MECEQQAKYHKQKIQQKMHKNSNKLITRILSILLNILLIETETNIKQIFVIFPLAVIFKSI